MTALLWRRTIAVLAAATLAPVALAQEADALLRRAAQAMGADQVKTLRYAGSGQGGQFGQAYLPTMPWPKVNYSSYVRQVDYESVFTSEEMRRSRAEPRGGGAIPLQGEAPFGGVANAERAWNLAGPNAAPRMGARVSRLHDLWITPHGVVKAAMRNPATLAFRTVDGRSLAAVSFAVPGIMTATALLNDDYLVERVESRYSDWVAGDVAVVTTYSGYRDYGGVKFPSRIEQTIAGSPTLAVDIREVQVNAAVATAVPDNVAKWSERVAAEKVADGVWFLAGGSHNSVAIEMSDHVILVEAPLDDGRAEAVFAETRKLVPGKPIRYVVASHNHFDHAGGLRYAVSQGAAVVVEGKSRAYFERVFANPARITPDALAKSGRKAKVVGVNGKMVMRDALRTVELYHIADTDHGDSMLKVYLPKEKLLVEADVFTPLPPNAPAPNPVNAYHVDLIESIEKNKLAVERILPLHGRVVPIAELYRMVGK
jgi:glyoxylase-like metal-dependent hydrolase (beta-lactamase superfamily II)